MKNTLLALVTLCISMLTYAGGNPEHVKLPDGYKTDFTNYDTRNRGNGKQLAVLYANKKATDSASASASALADGSTIVMEIYKVVAGEDGKPTIGEDDLFEKGKFAAIAVMEKRSNWDASFDAGQRSGDWGFAIYNTDGTVKANDLDCASCHVPLTDSDYLFSRSSLK
jgi:cytochrome P460